MPQPVDVKIRPAIPADVPAIVKMIHELAIYERAAEQCHATDIALHERLFGKRPAAEALMAEVGSQPAGFAIWFHNFSTWECKPGLYLEDLFVRPAWRRRGVGLKLLRALARIAEDRGCARFEWSVLDWNKPARDFYEKIGARAQPEWVTYRMEGGALADFAHSAGEDESTPLPPPRSTPTPKPAPYFDTDTEEGTLRRPLKGVQAATVYTDGGADPNPGVGGWAAVISQGEEHRELTGGELGTTNNRMELTAAIRALEALPATVRVHLHTDSAYVKNGITSWIKNWKRNNWRRRDKGGLVQVKNADLWKRLDELCSERTVEWGWVRGHSGHPDNERADELCTETIRALYEKSTEADRTAALDAEKRRQDDEMAGR